MRLSVTPLRSFAPAALTLLGSLALSAPAAASPINPWGVEVGKGVFAVTPFLFADQNPGAHPYLYGQYGVSDKVELLAGVGATVAPTVSFDSVEVMPRYFFSDTTGVALHLKYTTGASDVMVAPEWHGVYPAGPLTLSVNAGWGPMLGSEGFAAGTAYAYVAPEWYFTKASSVFVEVDPTVDLNRYDEAHPDRVALSVVPGVSTSIAGRHFFAVGVSVPVTGFDPSAIYAGGWYSIAFGGA